MDKVTKHWSTSTRMTFHVWTMLPLFIVHPLSHMRIVIQFHYFRNIVFPSCNNKTHFVEYTFGSWLMPIDTNSVYCYDGMTCHSIYYNIGPIVIPVKRYTFVLRLHRNNVGMLLVNIRATQLHLLVWPCKEGTPFLTGLGATLSLGIGSNITGLGVGGLFVERYILE